LFVKKVSMILCILFLLTPAPAAPGAGTTRAALHPAQDSTLSRLVWPSPPERARIRHLKTIASVENLEIEKEGFFSGLFNLLFGEKKSDRWLVQPVGIAVGGDGKIYVADPGARGVHIIDQKGKKYSFAGESDGTAFVSPVGVACAPGGRVYISDSELRKVVIADEDLGQKGVIREHLQRPTGLAIVGDTLFVADAGKHAVVLYTLDGTYVGEFGSRGAGDGEFNFPVAVAGRDTLYVVDALNYRVQEFGPGGKFVRSFGAQGNAAGRFASPKAVALDPGGNAYVTDALMDNVQIFNPAGQLLLVFGTHGGRDGEFMSPGGIAFDAARRVYIVDTLNRRIQIFECLP
jgi:DNA-binding beta-propeller fold protein YncE